MVYTKISRTTPERAIDHIYVQLSDGKSNLNLNHSDVYLKRVNYPMNCLTLNLTKFPVIKEHGLKTMSFYFKADSNITRVQINVQGSHLTGYRDLFDHSFYSTGDAIQGRTGFFSKYGVDIRENVFVEDDQSKQCVDYPTVEFENFAECDNQYMLDACAKEGILPIWLADNFDHVTTYHTYQPSFESSEGNSSNYIHRDSQCMSAPNLTKDVISDGYSTVVLKVGWDWESYLWALTIESVQ